MRPRHRFPRFHQPLVQCRLQPVDLDQPLSQRSVLPHRCPHRQRVPAAKGPEVVTHARLSVTLLAHHDEKYLPHTHRVCLCVCLHDIIALRLRVVASEDLRGSSGGQFTSGCVACS